MCLRGGFFFDVLTLCSAGYVTFAGSLDRFLFLWEFRCGFVM